MGFDLCNRPLKIQESIWECVTHSQAPWQIQIKLSMETTKRFGARGTLPALNTLKGQTGVLELQDGTRKSDKQFTHSCKPAQNQQISWLAQGWSTFGARTSHGRPRTHKIHHGPNSREATTFPYIVYFVPLREAHIQMAFCPGTPNPEIATVEIPATMWDHNFLCRPPITMRSEAKLQPSSRTFQRRLARLLHVSTLGQFPTFCGRESNCQFDSQPFFWS